MAQDSENRVSSAGDAIPMKKTGVTTYVAIAVGVLAIGAVVVVTSGGSDAAAEHKAAEIKAQSTKKDAPGMTAEQQREHMKMTARAFERAQVEADAKKAETERQKAAASQAESEAANAAAPPAGGPAPAGAPPPAGDPEPAEPPKPKVTHKAAKKQMDSLDSMGSDIATALE